MEITMRTIHKVIGALFLVAVILATQIPTIETGAAPNSDFQIDKTKLVKYTGTATSVSIPDTIKTIGAEAFAGNTTLTSISILVRLSHPANTPEPIVLRFLGKIIFFKEVLLLNTAFPKVIKESGKLTLVR